MVAIKGLYQKRGWWYFSRMRGGVRKTIALETRDESDAIRMALELANGPDLAIGGTLEGEIEARGLSGKADRLLPFLKAKAAFRARLAAGRRECCRPERTSPSRTACRKPRVAGRRLSYEDDGEMVSASLLNARTVK
jgi:hypothetical protein